VADVLDLRRIKISLSTREVLSLKSMLVLGRMFTGPDDKERARGVMRRIGGSLKKMGVDPREVDKLTDLQ